MSTAVTLNANDRILAYIRTYVPYGVGAALTWLLVHLGLDLTGPVQVALAAFSVALVTNLYYLVVRLFEVRYPAVGALLGFPKAPEYAAVDNLWASLIRTAIPTLVSAVIVSLSALFIHLDADTQSGFIAAASAVVSAAYYALAKEVTTRWPGTTVLLGVAAQPAFDPATVDTAEQVADLQESSAETDPAENAGDASVVADEALPTEVQDGKGEHSA